MSQGHVYPRLRFGRKVSEGSIRARLNLVIWRQRASPQCGTAKNRAAVNYGSVCMAVIINERGMDWGGSGILVLVYPVYWGIRVSQYRGVAVWSDQPR